MSEVTKIRQFYISSKGLMIFSVLEAILAYFLLSVAIDTANIASYLFGIILIFVLINNFVIFVRNLKGSENK